MARYLSTLSAILFFSLSGSFFLAYILLRNNIGGDAPSTWLEYADLPLIASALLYGGISLYMSLRQDAHPSRTLALTFGVPALLIFIAIVWINFSAPLL